VMRVLVVFGSKRGGTAGLADMIGDALTLDDSALAIALAGNLVHGNGSSGPNRKRRPVIRVGRTRT
jgi:hypothetical protein